jgi:nicotinate phosphoribosyltransferase
VDRDATIDKIVDLMLAAGSVESLTDKYFSHTRRVVEANGQVDVIYAVFLRRRVIAALEPAIRLLSRLVPDVRIKRFFEEGAIVPSETKLMEVGGPFAQLSEMETLLLQKIGMPCVCANNAYEMCMAMPDAGFLDMHARHASGPDMNLLAAYGAAVGSEAAKKVNSKVRGFVGGSQDLTAPLFGAEQGLGTMPHALIGYTNGDVLEALKLFVEAVDDNSTATALVDYAGAEVADSLRCARWFYDEAKLHEQGKTFGVRLDTHGGRFVEGLDFEKSVATVGDWLGVAGEYNIVERVLGERAFHLDAANILVDHVRRILFGQGVSAAAVIHVRKALDSAGYKDAKIVASSGFDAQKCIIMSGAGTPIDMVGTGSFLPETLSETYATADVISYGGERRVKVGREFLFD